MPETKRQFKISTLVAIVAVTASIGMPIVSMLRDSSTQYRQTIEAKVDKLTETVNDMKVTLTMQMATIGQRLEDHISGAHR